MSKETGVIVLGFFVAILPYLGFPESWRVVMYVLSGLGMVLLGFFLRADHLHRESSSLTRTSVSRPRTAVPTSKKVSDIATPVSIVENEASQ